MINRYMAFQMRELDEHKYYLSEKEQRDVGLDYTLKDWVSSGHAERFYKAYHDNKEVIDAICDSCTKCNGLYSCDMPNKLVHLLMDDEPVEIDTLYERLD